MKSSLQMGLLAVATIILGTFNSLSAVTAATFGQKEVAQTKFIAIAVPGASGFYNLVLLEQKSTKKKCWRESGTNPTKVYPLLLSFNFTGICSRSTDSNGYSLRQAGQDLGLDYRLSIEKRQGGLVLLGTPNLGRKGQAMEIGRTHGLSSGFLKIILNPGWRFSKRTYNGKILGHVYLTRDFVPANFAGSLGSVATRSPIPKRSVTSAEAISIPVPAPASRITTTRAIRATARSTSQPKTRAASTTSPTLRRPVLHPGVISTSKRSSLTSKVRYRVMVVTRNARQVPQIRTLVPDAFRSSYKGRPVMQVGSFRERAKAETIIQLMERNSFKAILETTQ